MADRTAWSPIVVAGSQCEVTVTLAQLEAENAALRDRAVELALEIQALQERRGTLW